MVFVVNGFSKAWAMTGWRIGWMDCGVGMDGLQRLDDWG
ncbi:MAG: aminotransferase class I/II-fold pyridoxal phosphate-dependent enzyme [Alphaproteobacteria bacterium]